MKSRRKVSDQVLEALATGLVEALERGCISWPLPSPPIFDSDFPPIVPSEPHEISEKGLALLYADRGMFDRHLTIVVDLIVPHRMNLTDDPFEVHEKWLLRRLHVLTERLLFAIATEWLAQALDESCPDPDRWWLAIALVNGLSNKSHGQPVHQGYHLVESIALGERPGTWHTQPEITSASMEWNPHGVVPRTTSLVAHDAGSKAAIWVLDRLEEGGEERRLLLIEWCKLLLERKDLIEPLGISKILIRRASDPSVDIASRVTRCLAKLLDGDKDAGMECIRILDGREEILLRRSMADVLTRLFRRIGEDAIPLLNKMLEDEDESVLAAASATVGDLRFLDQEMWADKIKELSSHPVRIVRRNLVHTLRDYIEAFSSDEREIISSLWQDGDEVVLTRLRELLMRMEEVDSERFATTLDQIRDLDLEGLWRPFEIKDKDRVQQWKSWLNGDGEMPETRAPPKVHISDMTEPEIPKLDDALATLDDLGFLD